jgi:hypothetical protein
VTVTVVVVVEVVVVSVVLVVSAVVVSPVVDAPVVVLDGDWSAGASSGPASTSASAITPTLKLTSTHRRGPDIKLNLSLRT